MKGKTVHMTIKGAALGALLAGLAAPAFADQATTTGGLKIKTDDGRFEFGLGGRIHFDAYAFMNDDSALYGSGLAGATTGKIPAQGGFAFRRAYLTLTGKAYGWKFKFENDFAAQAGSATSTTTCLPMATTPATPSCTTATTISNTGASGFREMWISAPIHNDGELIIGQFKPRRGLEEITSSNDLTMMERPYTTATGLYSGRQFLMGLGYKGLFSDMMMVEVDARGLGPANTTNEGWEYGGRFSFFPMADDGHILHLGASYSVDQEQSAAGSSSASTQATAVAQYAGRRGPSLNFGNVGNVNPAGTSDSAQKTIGLEAASAFGPVTLQAEYALANLEHTHLSGANPADSKVDAWYLQASWFVTGERMIYKKDRAALGKPKNPLNTFGAIELTGRYEFGENKDEDATNTICTISGGAAIISAPATADKCQATTATVGVNWYVNPNVRYMLNYYIGTADLGGTAGKDSPTALSLRTQFAF
jgi:phosphate-selective porin OprO/OprP